MWGSFTLAPSSMTPAMTNPVLPCKTHASCEYLGNLSGSGAGDCWFSGDQLPSPGQFPSSFCTSKKCASLLFRPRMLFQLRFTDDPFVAPRGLMIYWRLSAQIYLELSDFERLGRAVLNRTKHARFIELDRMDDDGTDAPVSMAQDERVAHARAAMMIKLDDDVSACPGRCS